ncbi:MAG: 4-hydroxy-tetrahydrodipicolinate reductase [Hydrotalea flava]|uniref:4-hydroxy-tetrahydrodipicolinate reductase n=1 Tax=Hydrotalea TaxID=1004300 RepID=UPI001025D353|nr:MULTISPECIES: 4-hydroxy-tetrahydrodipicolinate reductase [Hydrotalea]MBY0347026.1 4-hydroxy-tetrahydrodipicolinate reductase [Hydrotalea flava]RWZ90197.1 MAG: 4-hydroxy-tetrahydrodipicolinate reductase [Hydrotalea sp. AMD]
MKIALIGYGKMGQAIEKVAVAKGHEIVLKIDVNNAHELNAAHLQKADVAIEFTGPHSAFSNVMQCINSGTPVVCGSTGWLAKWHAIEAACIQQKGSLIYASNFSIGVNLFFELNKFLAHLMKQHPEYEVTITEIHHTQKKDAPSGTAISLAEQIMQEIPSKKKWVNTITNLADELSIISERIDPAPGTHKILYHSTIDDIEIVHTAHSRMGFADGAVLAAEFLIGKQGIFTMKDVLGLH